MVATFDDACGSFVVKHRDNLMERNCPTVDMKIEIEHVNVKHFEMYSFFMCIKYGNLQDGLTKQSLTALPHKNEYKSSEHINHFEHLKPYLGRIMER